MELTPSQREAITDAGGNLQLIACAGSGKTEVVARRVVHLLAPGEGDGLAPRNIIAFTFTDKAAAELVLNEVQQGLFVDRHCKQSGLTTSSDLAGAALKRYRDTKHYLGALSILREAEPIEVRSTAALWRMASRRTAPSSTNAATSTTPPSSKPPSR